MYPTLAFHSGTGLDPVVRARAVRADVVSSVGRLWIVLDLELRPVMAQWPSHRAEDTGTILGVPSGLRVVMRMTGVPQYRIPWEIG